MDFCRCINNQVPESDRHHFGIYHIPAPEGATCAGAWAEHYGPPQGELRMKVFVKQLLRTSQANDSKRKLAMSAVKPRRLNLSPIRRAVFFQNVKKRSPPENNDENVNVENSNSRK
uniref:Uncharacterized protein n=1 Tax=Loa loa TaxID=7209 RepID=A0A1I7VDU5_LOALO